MRALAFALGLICSTSGLSQHDSPYVRVTCSESNRTLIVEEHWAESADAIPREPGVQSLTDLTELRTIERPFEIQDYRVPKHEYVVQCMLDGSSFKVVVAPWKFNEKINGMCGGYAPSTNLSVWQGERRIINRLIFAGFCNPPENSFGVRSVTLIPGQAKITLVDEEGNYEKAVPFAELPHLERQALSRK